MLGHIRWFAPVLLICSLLVPIFGMDTRAADDANTQLSTTANAMLSLNSFHFDLETTAGSTTFQGMVELQGISGDVERPSSFRATVDVKALMLTLQLEVIGIDGSLWVKNPLGDADSFIEVTGGDFDIQLPPEVFLNPDRLVTAALEQLDDPQIAGTETLAGEPTTVVTGTFDPSKIPGLDTTGTDLDEFQPASEPLDVKVWIDDQDRLVRIDFIGPLFTFEEGTGRLVRTFTFSDFDEDLNIQAPA